MKHMKNVIKILVLIFVLEVSFSFINLKLTNQRSDQLQLIGVRAVDMDSKTHKLGVTNRRVMPVVRKDYHIHNGIFRPRVSVMKRISGL